MNEGFEPPSKLEKSKILIQGHPTLFTIKLYHGGEFTNFRDRKYIERKVNYVDIVDIDEFSIHDLDAIMRGLRRLGNDADLLNLAQYVADHKLIRVYTEHGECTLLTYYMNPKPVRKVTMEQLDEDDEVGTAPVLEQVIETPSKTGALVVSSALNAIVPISPEYNRTRFWNKENVLSSCSKRLIMEEFDIGLYQQILEGDSVEQVGISATKHVGTSAAELVEEIATDQVQEEVVEDDQVVNELVVEEDEAVNEEVVEQEQVEEIKQEQFEEQYAHVTEAQLDDFNLQDYMNFLEFQDEGNAVEVEGGDEVEVEGDQHSQTDDDDSEDSDYWVDEENLIPGVEVNMRDFHMSIDTDVEFMEGPLNTNKGTDDDEDSDLDRKMRAVLKDLGKENVCSEGQVHKVTFHIGQKYKSKKELKEKIQLHALETSISTTEDSWYVKTYVQQHTCLNTRKIRSATASFLSKQIMDQVETNLTVPVRSLQTQLQKKYHVGFSIHKIFRAKSQAKKLVEGDYTKQYEVLRDYILELQSTNPDTTVKLDLVSEPNLANVTTRCFKRIYICLGAMKKGFRVGMRDFLGLDDAFMK
ncbi:hypothetical protein LXL04_004663 [Taraxacum kok-saghyz]